MQAITNEFDFDPTKENLVVLKFWAAWCGPCKRMDPILSKLEKEFDTIKFLSVDIDKIHSLGQRYQVRSLPTLIFLKNGLEFKRINGLSMASALRSSLAEFAKEDS